jgi:glycosyltransferase involved in cell wall biosynthesis
MSALDIQPKDEFNPLVSALCCTYGRPEILGEAIQCFLDQDYDNKELIIVNDQEGVTLSIDDCPENVHIFNSPMRFECLGEKRNYSKDIANGDFMCIWDDDDLYTPWRISESVELMRVYNSKDLIKPRKALMSTNNKDYKVVSNLFHSQATFSRKYMEDNDYPEISVGEDSKFETGANAEYCNIEPLFWYVYRWGQNVHHLSGIADEGKSWERALTWPSYQDMEGEIKVVPGLKKDYWSEIGSFLGSTVNPLYQDKWNKRLQEAKERS